VTLETCELSTKEITIKSTIPIPKDTERGLPKITFWMPPDINLVDANSSCEITLPEGLESKKIKIRAACKNGGVTEGQQMIIPRVFTKTTKAWSHRNVILPQIMVWMYCYSVNNN